MSRELFVELFLFHPARRTIRTITLIDLRPEARVVLDFLAQSHFIELREAHLRTHQDNQLGPHPRVSRGPEGSAQVRDLTEYGDA